MFISVLSAMILTLFAHKEPTLAHPDEDAFKKRVHFSALEGVVGVDGVLADWDDLAKILSVKMRGKDLSLDDATPLERGEVSKSLTWYKRDEGLTISIFVSGVGYRLIHERLLAEASNTTRVDIPFRAGPAGLGDFAVCDLEETAHTIIWVYRNVCVEVSDHAYRDVEPIARIVQKFMEAHRVARLAEHLPRVERVDVSAKQIHVGEEWRVSFELGKKTPIESVLTDIDEERQSPVYGWPYRLESIKHSPLGAIYRGVAPGTARVQIRVVDRKTLLSPPLSVTVDVLPAR